MAAREDLEKLAMQVRATYYLERKLYEISNCGAEQDYAPMPQWQKNPCWDGGQDKFGKRYTSVWKRIVKFASTNSVDPTLLVKATFLNRRGSKIPMPTEVATEQSLQQARIYGHSMTEYITQQFEAYRHEAQNRLCLKRLARPTALDSELWRAIITSPELDASALFRYGLANDAGEAELARRLRHSAMMEYIKAPDSFDKVMGTFLPLDFREGSRQYLKRLIQSD